MRHFCEACCENVTIGLDGSWEHQSVLQLFYPCGHSHYCNKQMLCGPMCIFLATHHFNMDACETVDLKLQTWQIFNFMSVKLSQSTKTCFYVYDLIRIFSLYTEQRQ